MNRECRIWNSRSVTVAEAARRRIAGDVLAFVSDVVKNAGGSWNANLRDVALAKADSLLSEPHSWTVILYNATTVVHSSGWSEGSQDEEFPRLVHRTVCRVGRLLPDVTIPVVLELLCELSADPHDGRYLSPEVAENIRRRMRGDGGPDHLAEVG